MTLGESRFPAYLSLFASVSTLLCCALPSLLVLLGLGATVASFLSVVPWLVTLSHHKAWVFGIAGVLFAANVYYVRVLAPRLQAQGGGCAPDQQAACDRARRQSTVLLAFSAVLLGVGFAVAYLLPLVLARVDQ